MKLEALCQPVSDEAPCGPDLNAGMDPEYDEYYFGALGRLPGFYFRPGVQRPDGTQSPDLFFDASDVDHAAEAKAINSLLERSRDLRLLVLRAQWEALAGRLGPMSDAVEAIGALLETFGDDVHPTLSDGPSERRDAVADLSQPVTIVQPLQFAGLTGTGEVTLRKIRVANGQGNPMADEEELQAGRLMDALGDEANRKRVDDNHAALLKLSVAYERIDRACQTNATAPFSAPLDLVKQTVSEMLDAITSARPDLRAVEAPAGPDFRENAGVESAAESGPEVTASAVIAGPPTDIKNHIHARNVLEACEHYYRRAEPSSAALLLVTQARLLIGKPLIEALETLLPSQAGQAFVDFGPKTGFALNSERLKQLTASGPQSQAPESQPEPSAEPTPQISSSADAAGAIRSVEDYFRHAERSSPVPVLLQRARSYLDKDFQSLVDELIPKATEG